MKKIFFVLAALVLAFTGCSQEEDAIQVSEKKAAKVVGNMDKPGFGTDARAARQGWEDGDEVVAVLNNGNVFRYLKLTYDGTLKTWETKVLQPNSAGAFEEVIGAPSSLYDLIKETGKTGHGMIPAYKESCLVGIVRWRKLNEDLAGILDKCDLDQFIRKTSIEEYLHLYPQSGHFTIVNKNVTLAYVLENYELDRREKAWEFSGMIFPNSKDKINFMHQYLGEEGPKRYVLK